MGRIIFKTWNEDGSMYLYKNGELSDTTTQTGSLNNSWQSIYIGAPNADSAGDGYITFEGYIDELKIYG